MAILAAKCAVSPLVVEDLTMLVNLRCLGTKYEIRYADKDVNTPAYAKLQITMAFSCCMCQNEAASGSGVFHVDIPFPIVCDLVLNFDQAASYNSDILAIEFILPASTDNNNNNNKNNHRCHSPGSTFMTRRRYKGKIFEFSGSITKLELEPTKISISASYDFGKMRLMGGGGFVETITFTAFRKSDTSCDVVYSFACLPVTWRGRLALFLFRKNFVDGGHELFRGEIQSTIAEGKRRMMLLEEEPGEE